MKLITPTLLVTFFLSTAAAATDDASVPANSTLKQLFHSALKNSETIAISRETVRRADSFFRKALGDMLPELFYNRRVSREQFSKTGHDGSFELAKSDFTLWGDLANVRAANATLNQRRHERRRTEQILLKDVAVAFYGMLLAQENVAASKKLVELARERAAELDKRVQLGKTRRADALGQSVLIGSFESQLVESVRQVEERHDLLEYWVAAPVAATLAMDNERVLEPASLDSYLATVASRPDIEASREEVRSFQGSMEATRADFFPSFGVSASSYTDRALSSAREDWDVLITMSLPLWDWGSRGAAMDAAGADLTESEKELSRATRLAELEIRNAYRDYEAAKKQLLVRKQSVEFARQDFDMQVEDDKRGLVTSLDVLASLDRLNSAELAYNSARLQQRLAAIHLKIAAGSDPKDILG